MIPDPARWDVVRVRIRPGDKDLHPAAILSRSEVCRDPKIPVVNVLYGTTRRPAAEAGQTDVVLNSAEGLERQSLFNCDHIYTVRKESIESRLGRVSYERRRVLCRTVTRAFAFLS